MSEIRQIALEVHRSRLRLSAEDAIQGDRSVTATWTVSARALMRTTRVSNSGIDLLLNLSHAVFEAPKLRDGHHVGYDRPQRGQPDGFRGRTVGELLDPRSRPGHAARHLAHGLIEDLAATRLDPGPDPGMPGPPEGCSPRHTVCRRPVGDRRALRDRDDELRYLAFSNLL